MNTGLRYILSAVALFSLATGAAQALVVYENDFESGSLGSEWTTYSSTTDGRVQVSNVLGSPAKSGSYHLAMDRFPSGTATLNEATLTLDLSGLTGVTLSFWHKDVNDEDDPLPASFSGHANGDGVSFSVDGNNWYRLISLNNSNSTNQIYTGFLFDLDAAAATAGVVLGSNTQIKFQQYDNFPFNSDGRAFDDVLVSAVPVPSTALLLGLGLLGLSYRSREQLRTA